jgi:chromosome partitioning protein
MPVVAVINRKGGSGKSTLATHLAAWCARNELKVMLGDVDRQQSALAWLRRRGVHPLAQGAEISGWALDGRSVLRPAAGITHVVLDTPGGLRGPDLARVVMYADAILLPVCDSMFDRESALECHQELMTLPRVAGGRCRIGVVGMRLDARTKAEQALQEWSTTQGLRWVGGLRATQGYVRCIELGLTVFDLPATKADADQAQWQPILDWLQGAWREAARVEIEARISAKPNTVGTGARFADGAEPAKPARPRLPPAPLGAPPVHATLQGPPRGFAGRLGWLFNAFRSPT